MKKRSQVDLHRVWLIIGLVVVVVGVLFLVFGGKTLVGEAYVSGFDSYKNFLVGKGAVNFFPLDTFNENDVLGSLPSTWNTFGLPAAEIYDGVKISGNSYIKADLPAPSDSFSVSTWIKTDYAGLQTVFQVGSENHEAYALRMDNGQLSGGQINPLSPTPTPINDGRWHFVTMTYEQTGPNVYTTSFYVDGVLDSTSNGEIIYDTDASDGYVDTFNIGAELVTSGDLVNPGDIFGGPDNFFTGSIGEVVVYSGVLTVDDMNAIKAQSVYTNLVAHWKMQPVPGALDISALLDYEGTNDLTGVLPETVDKCVDGGCLFFEGVSSLAAPENLAMEVGAGDFSISLWVNTRSSQRFRSLFSDYNGGTAGYDLRLVDGVPFWEIIGGSSVAGTFKINDGAWHHILVTRGDSVINLFVDGVKTSAVAGGVDTTNTAVVTVGSQTMNNPFHGYLDEVKFYKDDLSKKLNPEEIIILSVLPTAARTPEPKLVSYVPLDTQVIVDEKFFDQNGKLQTYLISGADPLHSTQCPTADCLEFDGASFIKITPDQQSIPPRLDIQGNHAGRTISVWFKPNSVVGKQVLFETGGTHKGYNIFLDGPLLYAGVWDDSLNSVMLVYSLAGEVQVGQWYQVVVTMDSLNVRSDNALIVYLDGVNVSHGNARYPTLHTGSVSIAGSSSTLFHDGTRLLASDAPNYFFNGALDDLRIYNDVLRPAEIQTSFQENYRGNLVVEVLVDGVPRGGLPIALGSSVFSTNFQGQVTFPNLPVGEYVISISVADGEPITREIFVGVGTLSEGFELVSNQLSQCNDELDGDGNGLVDCVDPSCRDSGVCVHLQLNDGCSTGNQCVSASCYQNLCNDIPVGIPQTGLVYAGESIPVNLQVFDLYGEEMVYSYTQPLFGTLTGSAPNLIYTADKEASGLDTFTFIGNDGAVDSAPVSVSLVVEFCGDGKLTGPEECDGGVGCTEAEAVKECTALAGFACDNENICTSATGLDLGVACSLASQCSSGRCDGVCNYAPVVEDFRVSGYGGEPIEITLSGVDDEALIFSVENPLFGSIAGVSPTFSYLPPGTATSLDEFKYSAMDVHGASAFGKVTLDLTFCGDLQINDLSEECDVSDPHCVACKVADGYHCSILGCVQVPQVESIHSVVYEGQVVRIPLLAMDPEGGVVTYTITQPTYGSTELSGSTVVYQAPGSYSPLVDRFTYTATSTSGASASSEVVLNLQGCGDGTIQEDFEMCDGDNLGGKSCSEFSSLGTLSCNSCIYALDLCELDADGDGYVATGDDCNDGNAVINPGMVEVCGNGIDDNCDGVAPICLEGDSCLNAASCEAGLTCLNEVCQVDADGDGYANDVDCDDARAQVHEGCVGTVNLNVEVAGSGLGGALVNLGGSTLITNGQGSVVGEVGYGLGGTTYSYSVGLPDGQMYFGEVVLATANLEVNLDLTSEFQTACTDGVDGDSDSLMDCQELVCSTESFCQALDIGVACGANLQCMSNFCLGQCVLPGDVDFNGCVDSADITKIIPNLNLWCVPSDVPSTPVAGDVFGNGGQGDGCVNNDDIRIIIPFIGVGCS